MAQHGLQLPSDTMTTLNSLDRSIPDESSLRNIRTEGRVERRTGAVRKGLNATGSGPGGPPVSDPKEGADRVHR